MTQIAFVTLLLGLISGAHRVEVSASGPVAAIEIQLDGAPVGTLSGPPWAQRVDFGPELLPHELVARALDAEGREIARTRQWVNLPRPPAEIALSLEGEDPAKPRSARLTWESLVATAPRRVSLTLDGRPLEVDGGGRASLPPLKLDMPHVLTAEVDFGPGVAARRDVLLGTETGELFGELTSTPVRLRGGELPPPERLQGWFSAGGAPLSPVAVEDEPRQIVVVRDSMARRVLAKLPGISGNPPHLPLGRKERLHFISVNPRRIGKGSAADLFDPSPEFNSWDRGIYGLLTQISFPAENSAGQRLADAVAVAGLQAFAGNHPRAVLLVLGPEPVDASLYEPAAIRRYLAALRVPLHVWSLAPPASSPVAAAWGGAQDIASRASFIKAFEDLRADLESQRIVFLEGLHLPQAIRLTPAATGVELP
jgi:hypothetical protein